MNRLGGNKHEHVPEDETPQGDEADSTNTPCEADVAVEKVVQRDCYEYVSYEFGQEDQRLLTREDNSA